MKRQCVCAFVCLFAGLSVAVLPAVTQNTSCIFSHPLMANDPNARDTTHIFSNSMNLTATGQERWFRFPVIGGRSYSVWTTFPSDANNEATGGIPDTILNLFINSCSASAFAINDDDFSREPVVPFRGSRVSFRSTEEAGVAAGSFSFLNIRVTGFGGVFNFRFNLHIVETTLFSPRWSTFGGFETSWGFQNTSNATITATLTVLRNDGSVEATTSFTIPPRGVAFQGTRPSDLNIADNRAGTAVLTHNGPPGGIQADGFMVSPDGLTGFPVKFEPRSLQQ